MAISRENPKVFKFDGQHFKMSQMKMEYLLKALKILYMLNTNCPGPFGYGSMTHIKMIKGNR